MTVSPNTRRARFGLRAVFVVVAVVAIPCAWLSWLRIEARRRAEVIQWVVDRERPKPPQDGILYQYNHFRVSPRWWKIKFGNTDQLSWPRRLVGDLYAERVAYPLNATDEQIEWVQQVLSEATVIDAGDDLRRSVKEALEQIRSKESN